MMSWHMYRPIVVALIHQLASAALGTLLLLVVVVDCCILQPKLHTHPTTHSPHPTQTPPTAAARLEFGLEESELLLLLLLLLLVDWLLLLIVIVST